MISNQKNAHILETISNARVLLRADLNVPMAHGIIQDDYRLLAFLPTLDALLANNNAVILATHIGRPKNNEPELSTRTLMQWFAQRGYTIQFEPDIIHAAATNYPPKTIVLLENLRFNPGEKNHDKKFAQQLAATAEYYVNDAFALMHRDDTSITDVPKLFAPEKRCLGFLVEQELAKLASLQNNPQQPYLVFLGGGKVSTKIPLMNNLLQNASMIFLTPAIVFTFLKALNKNVGKSLVDDACIPDVIKFMEKARDKNVTLMFPLDYQIALDSINGPLSIVDADALPSNGIGMSIGPKTIAAWREPIMHARTIFLNAAMGFAMRPETMQGLNELLAIIAASPAYSIIGGGDSVAAARAAGFEKKIDYLSTGGGATLALLAHEPLPGLEPFIKK